jgi:hypothetical protein
MVELYFHSDRDNFSAMTRCSDSRLLVRYAPHEDEVVTEVAGTYGMRPVLTS